MGCPAAKAAVKAQITSAPKTAEDIFKMINWWTLPTIIESLAELAEFNHLKMTEGAKGEIRYQAR